MAYDFADIEFLMQDKRGKTGAIHEKIFLDKMTVLRLDFDSES